MNTIDTSVIKPIGENQLVELTRILSEYKTGKSSVDKRVIAAESWWKLRNTTLEKDTSTLMGKGFTSQSGWLHNVITSKHSDAMEAFPEPNILPREEDDKGEATMLSSIIPCVLEQNHFEDTYSTVMWNKMKTGTGVYKVVWNKHKMNGLGDIEISAVSLLNIFWEPGVTDIQKSKYFFHTELVDKDILLQTYPNLFPNGVINGNAFTASKYAYDDAVKTDNKVTVIECYYHKPINGKNTLQYIKYVGNTVINATENDNEPIVIDPMSGTTAPSLAETGLYDHGLYPYVFDPLFPIEGSPVGYGFVDLCQRTQAELDLLKTNLVQNARVNAKPRYFSRTDGSINEEEFLDLDKDIVHVAGSLDENFLRQIDTPRLDGALMNLLDWDVNELRETSGNTETSTGSVPSGVTSGAAIAALQTASGKGSKDATRGSYRKYGQVVELLIELIRQFYSLPRKFRILGQYGAERYISYTNAGIQPQAQGNDFGQDGGMRLPLFDVRVTAQTQNVYTKMSQNELAIQFFNMGFFNPQMTDSALMCLDIMDFEGKDALMQKIAQNGTMFDKLMQYMQLSFMLAQVAAPQHLMQIQQDMINMGMQGNLGGGTGGSMQMTQTDNLSGKNLEEAPTVEKARARAESASQPNGM